MNNHKTVYVYVDLVNTFTLWESTIHFVKLQLKNKLHVCEIGCLRD